MVRHQVEEIILSLFTIESGKFTFKEMTLPTEEVITLKLSAANLIYYGVKRINNFRRTMSELSSLDSLICFSANPIHLFQDIKLDEAGRKIISCVDDKTSIKEIVTISQLDNFEALKTIYALLNIWMIETKNEYKLYDVPPEQVAEGIIEEKGDDKKVVQLKIEIEKMHKKYEGLGYYGVLGVKTPCSNA